MHYHLQRNQGMVLIASLVMVVIIAVISIAIAQQVSSGQRSAAYHQDNTLSYINTNSGLVEAEAIVREKAYTTTELNPDDPSTIVIAAFTDANWWKVDANWGSATGVNDVDDNALAGAPEYLIESAGVDSGLVMNTQIPKRRFLRITSKAAGADTAVSYHQSFVAIFEN